MINPPHFEPFELEDTYADPVMMGTILSDPEDKENSFVVLQFMDSLGVRTVTFAYENAAYLHSVGTTIQQLALGLVGFREDGTDDVLLSLTGDHASVSDSDENIEDFLKGVLSDDDDG